ncbi:hypothetical protein DRJ17_00035 [Candidatus Woesearchaeota archaeon]|nr:MAG: hypothetical protein DRJ17_00035 [Candidatus Woesearchaeota archaeon]
MRRKKGTIHVSLRFVVILLLIMIVYAIVFLLVKNTIETGVKPPLDLDKDTEHSFYRVYNEIMDMQPGDVNVEVPLVVKNSEVVFYKVEPKDVTRERPEECKDKPCMCIYAKAGYGYRCERFNFDLTFASGLVNIPGQTEIQQTLVSFHNTRTIVLNRHKETIEIDVK